MIRRNEKDLEIFIANKTKSNPDQLYTYVRNEKVITTNIGPLHPLHSTPPTPIHLENGKVTNTELKMTEALINDTYYYILEIR